MWAVSAVSAIICYDNVDITYNRRTPMYPHRPSYITHTRSRAHLTCYLPTVYSPHKSSIAAY